MCPMPDDACLLLHVVHLPHLDRSTQTLQPRSPNYPDHVLTSCYNRSSLPALCLFNMLQVECTFPCKPTSMFSQLSTCLILTKGQRRVKPPDTSKKEKEARHTEHFEYPLSTTTLPHTLIYGQGKEPSFENQWLSFSAYAFLLSSVRESNVRSSFPPTRVLRPVPGAHTSP